MEYSAKYPKLISEEQKDANVKKTVLRLFSGITLAVCIAYGSGVVISSHIKAMNTEEAETPRLVILGKEDEETVAIIAEEISHDDGSVMSLEDFLSKLICGACSRRCPLLSPRCTRGKSKAETQTAYYEQAVDLLSGEGDGISYNDLSFE
ncbi:MAG: hypothetical protein LUC89_02985 [Oscillospiraceae bacterium]|nr:hypothetical protein [Oscillospiraceae bacterium]